MMNNNHQSHQPIWHPFTSQGPKQNSLPLIEVERGEGAYLITKDGRRIFDGISSWWVNLHGHAHPYMHEKISRQLSQLEHVIFAGFTHPGAETFARRILPHFKGEMGKRGKIFFSDNGSTAVEVALKMSLQFWYNQNQNQKTNKRQKFLCLTGGYHGDTFGAMSVGDRGPFNEPFDHHLFSSEDVFYIDPPTPQLKEKSLAQVRQILARHADEIAAFIFEPLVQGTHGMVMQDPQALDQILKEVSGHGILLIADEVMTGFYRTGNFFAHDILETPIDLVCLSKGITGGYLPLGATFVHPRVHEVFISDEKKHTFYHGHSYTGNPISLSAALASLDLMEKEETKKNIELISISHQQFVSDLKNNKELLAKCLDVRSMGTILAVEIKTESATSYFSSLRDKIYQYFLNRDLLLRPLGNIIYVIPPYCTTQSDLDIVYAAIKNFLKHELS